MTPENAWSGLSIQQMTDAFRNVPCGLVVYRVRDGKLYPLLHNPAFYELMGFTPEHVRSVEQETRFLGVHPEDLDELWEKVGQAVQSGGRLSHTYRMWNDARGEYLWIHVDGSIRDQGDGTQLLYNVYSDVTRQSRLETSLTQTNEQLQDIVNSIPGGVAIYKVGSILETVYFSDGVPALSGYTVEEYRELIRRDAMEMTYWEDTPMVFQRVQELIRTGETASFEFRKQHRNGRIVWVRVQANCIGEEDGCPLIHCVFHNITDLKEAQLEMDHLVNSIPGGIASYRVEGDRFIPAYYSDGVVALTGHTRAEFEAILQGDVFNTMHPGDRGRVLAAAQQALKSGEVLDVSYRARHKSGDLVWIHLYGRRMDPMPDGTRFYAVFTGMSAESRLFQNIANETADGIYVIARNDYDLLYVNEARPLFNKRCEGVGEKCYRAIYGRNEPCGGCAMQQSLAEGGPCDLIREENGRFYSIRSRETEWNGLPAFVQYVRDVTEEIQTRREKERLEEYFQTVLRHLPGGVAVVRHDRDGSIVPEFMSDGFAALVGMTKEDTWELYGRDAMAGVHPADREWVTQALNGYIASGASNTEMTYRLRRGDGDYVWVKNTLSMIHSGDGVSRVYAVYHDMTGELEERERLRQKYNELLLQHYRAPAPDALLVGHCNVTRDCILEVIDHVGSGVLERFGSRREEFFRGLGGLLEDPEERRRFWDTYLNGPTLAAFEEGRTELLQTGFLRLPGEKRGRYARFKVDLVQEPDSGDLTGILTVTDVTEQIVANRILHQLSVTGYDLVTDVDLYADRQVRLSGGGPNGWGDCYSAYVKKSLLPRVLPKDRKQVEQLLDRDYILDRLQREGSYSASYGIQTEAGETLTKNLTVSAIDLRLGRVCLARVDVTGSVREQQRLLNVIAYTFEMLALIDVESDHMTLYSRQALLEGLPPFSLDGYSRSLPRIKGFCEQEDRRSAAVEQFSLPHTLRVLAEKPGGYDFVLPYQDGERIRYKQINVLWGDREHKTVCMVRADVTDMLAAERRNQKALKAALAEAEEASRAKSDFLSSMSHDIRTPLNAIVGMTALAEARLDEREKVEDCLRKIALSSRHLLSLINDILDMSKIERAGLTLGRKEIELSELIGRASSMIQPQTQLAGLQLTVRQGEIRHRRFLGDALRIDQILINLLGNAVKFTPEGGRVDFSVEEVPPLQPGARVRYRFEVRDTGVGMSGEFQKHLFEPFTRGGESERVEGSGLGLSITKGLVDLMGGQITVESKPLMGSTFRVELEFDQAEERARPAEPSPVPAAPKGEGLTGRSFLVAEDNPINAEILCELLQMQGAKTTVRPDGLLAVQAFEDAPPGTYDAILMDVRMPHMNGYEATRAIRALDRPDAASIPIVAMTANAFAEDVKMSLEAGMNAHVAKPIDIQLLWSVLNDLLNG